MITLHQLPARRRSMRSLWVLHELGVPFAVQTYALDKSLRALLSGKEPCRRVPALEIRSVRRCSRLGQSPRCFCERFSAECSWAAPLATPERVQWLVWVHFCETIPSIPPP